MKYRLILILLLTTHIITADPIAKRHERNMNIGFAIGVASIGGMVYQSFFDKKGNKSLSKISFAIGATIFIRSSYKREKIKFKNK